jgi:type I restriction enzyme S subunit
MDRFDHVAVALLARMKNNIQLVRTLGNLRDTLLPRLISGKLRVPEAESMLSEVL